MRGKVVLAILLLGVAALMPRPVRAVDVMTLSSTAPQALDLAQMWSPHAISAMQSGGMGLVQVGASAMNILKLPLGLVQCTLGYPFGYGETGLENCVSGMAAPFELLYNTMMLPVRLLSLGTVR